MNILNIYKKFFKNYIIFIKILLLFLFVFQLFKYFFSKNDKKKVIKNIKICICTLGKKENRYIREFSQFYKELGIDKIFLYDNNDINDERFEEVISDYIDEGYIKLINKRGLKQQLYKIMNDCYRTNYQKFDWLLFFEIDEYINLKNYSNIKNFLKENKFQNCNVIYLNWVLHTDNNLIYYENKSLHERFPILEPNVLNKNKNYSNPVKSILKGNISNIKINNVHILNSNLKNTCNGFGNEPQMDNYYMKNADFKYYYIDHYYCKSVEEFIYKINMGCAILGDNIDYKLHRIHRYFKINKITIEKINFIENKTGINLSKFKLLYYKNNTKL